MLKRLLIPVSYNRNTTTGKILTEAHGYYATLHAALYDAPMPSVYTEIRLALEELRIRHERMRWRFPTPRGIA